METANQRRIYQENISVTAAPIDVDQGQIVLLGGPVEDERKLERNWTS